MNPSLGVVDTIGHFPMYQIERRLQPWPAYKFRLLSQPTTSRVKCLETHTVRVEGTTPHQESMMKNPLVESCPLHQDGYASSQVFHLKRLN